MHLTLGILRQSQAVFYALAFFWLDGFAVPAPGQVAHAVETVEKPRIEKCSKKSPTLGSIIVELWLKCYAEHQKPVTFQRLSPTFQKIFLNGDLFDSLVGQLTARYNQ